MTRRREKDKKHKNKIKKKGLRCSELAACQGDMQPVLPSGIPLKSFLKFLSKSLLEGGINSGRIRKSFSESESPGGVQIRPQKPNRTKTKAIRKPKILRVLRKCLQIPPISLLTLDLDSTRPLDSDVYNEKGRKGGQI